MENTKIFYDKKSLNAFILNLKAENKNLKGKKLKISWIVNYIASRNIWLLEWYFESKHHEYEVII